MYSLKYGWDKSEQNSVNMNLSARFIEKQVRQATRGLKQYSPLFRNLGIRYEQLASRSIRFVSNFQKSKVPMHYGVG